MFNYSNFKQEVAKRGLSKINRFKVQIAIPRGMTVDNTTAGVFSMYCASLDINGVNVTTAPIRYTGEQFEVPYDRAFSGATMTFLVDRGMAVRKFFDDWVNIIQDPTHRTFGYYKDFVSGEVTVTVLDKADEEQYSITMYDVIPKTIGSLSLNNASPEFMTMNVNFDFHYYTTESAKQIDNNRAVPGSNDLGSNQPLSNDLGEFNDAGYGIEDMGSFGDQSEPNSNDTPYSSADDF